MLKDLGKARLIIGSRNREIKNTLQLLLEPKQPLKTLKANWGLVKY
tara:strand:+ start:542 stop:679 length:138 start_codon:yes stop_codon:yes gene_type:complete